MNKKHLHHVWRQLRVIKPWYFLVIAVMFALISVYSLRQNNLTMVRLREKVYQADEQNGDVETALRNLRTYVYAHMNTNLASGDNAIYPPLQLKFSYERALEAAKATGTDANAQIYTDAQADCERRFPQGLSGSGRIPCIQEYVASRGVQAAPFLPPASLYQFDFVSPDWSPDVAGFSLLATGIFAALFVISWISDRWLRAELDL
ncbi:MAG: hypothetical protein QG553_304 [Patescibacteria group bacterium]|nr:hypothetical protein [Patescibacteria group bacterium]